MSVQDAKGILTGGPDRAANTRYFSSARHRMRLRKNSSPPVRKSDGESEARAGVRRDCRERHQVRRLVKEDDSNLEDYITRRTLDGLFVGIADEEKKIRENPKAAASSIVKKVFGRW